MSISICTQLLDWNFGLREALPTWLKFQCDEIIIFDFSFGKEAAKDVVDQFPDPRIKLFVPTSPVPFNTSVGRNISMDIAAGDVIFYIDSDVKLLKPVDLTKIKPNNFMQGCKYVGNENIVEDELSYNKVGKHWIADRCLGNYMTSLNGEILFWKEQFIKMNGFDERMKGWGFNDIDFYNRLVRSGYERIDFPQDTIQHIEHDNDIRVRNFETKDIHASNKTNIKIAGNPWNNSCIRTKVELKRLV
jgi:predicted glycosyltransferase involved in capsule biosynthesis